MNTANTTAVTEAEFQAATAELIECQRGYTALLDADDATNAAQEPALRTRLNAAQAIVDAYWAQAPEGFVARQLLQQPDL